MKHAPRVIRAGSCEPRRSRAAADRRHYFAIRRSRSRSWVPVCPIRSAEEASTIRRAIEAYDVECIDTLIGDIDAAG